MVAGRFNTIVENIGPDPKTVPVSSWQIQSRPALKITHGRCHGTYNGAGQTTQRTCWASCWVELCHRSRSQKEPETKGKSLTQPCPPHDVEFHAVTVKLSSRTVCRKQAE